MSTKIVGTGDSEGLRRVEKDVLISKKMKEKAMELCSSYVKGNSLILRLSHSHV